MAEYVYEGPGPVTGPEGAVVHPGDKREFDAEPAWGPWREIGQDDPQASPVAPVTPAAAPATPAPAPAPAKEM